MHGIYTNIGLLKNREAIFKRWDGEFAIEKDHSYLVEAQPHEIAAIIEKYPNLKLLPADIRRARP